MLASRKEASSPQAMEDEIGALKTQIESLTVSQMAPLRLTSLQAVVKSLAERLAHLEKLNNVAEPDTAAAPAPQESS